MNIKRTLLILIPGFFINCYIYSQSQAGIKTGIINLNIFVDYPYENSKGFIGLNYEYTPPYAIFSVSTEMQYVIGSNWLLMPVSINFNPGNRVKLLFGGGVLPVLRLEKSYPNKSLSFGGMCRMGIAYKLNKSICISSTFEYLFIPYWEVYYSHFDSSDISRSLSSSQGISLGVNYVFGTKKKQGANLSSPATP